MANTQATTESLLNIARLIQQDRIKTLRIQPRKSGENKGKLWIDWTVKEPDPKEALSRLQRQKVAETLHTAAMLMVDGKPIHLEISKASARVNRYNVRLEVLRL